MGIAHVTHAHRIYRVYKVIFIVYLQVLTLTEPCKVPMSIPIEGGLRLSAANGM